MTRVPCPRAQVPNVGTLQAGTQIWGSIATLPTRGCPQGQTCEDAPCEIAGVGLIPSPADSADSAESVDPGGSPNGGAVSRDSGPHLLTCWGQDGVRSSSNPIKAYRVNLPSACPLFVCDAFSPPASHPWLRGLRFFLTAWWASEPTRQCRVALSR